MTAQGDEVPFPVLRPGFPDEVFIWGEMRVTVLIWKLIEKISQLPEIEIQTWSTHALLQARRADRYEEKHIVGMTPERMNQPLLICGINDEIWVLDGNHRLEARHRAGLEDTEAIFVESLEGCLEPLPW